MTKYEQMQMYVDGVTSDSILDQSEENIEFADLTKREFEEWKDKHMLEEVMY